MSKSPIKRHESLRPLSREHHHGLLCAWKIREGLKRNVEPARIRKYTSWFWNSHLHEHFRIEESFVFTILPSSNELVQQALDEHKTLQNLFAQNDESEDSLTLLEKTLDAHIRFEERTLFNAIQEVATPEQFKIIEQNHDESFVDNFEDEFWV